MDASVGFRCVMDDPERLAAAIGQVLPTAIAQATADARMGHVLAPVMEKAAESSIRNDPATLVNILYPTIVPAIRKSIGETIDATFQRLNQTLKYSLTWRGLKWRWEAWRTGTSFAEVVLKHTLVYQVEHVFLVHRHTGLLIAHVAAEIRGVNALPSSFMTPRWVMYWSMPTVWVIATAIFVPLGDQDGLK